MELKHDLKLSDDDLFEGFNRTFMELKQAFDQGSTAGHAF